jgi:NitT/TauT family transport system substrate-binding protein
MGLSGNRPWAEVAARDPFFLVGRSELKPFDLRSLTGLKLSSVSEVPTPWLCLQEDLRDCGLDPAQIDRVADRSMADNLLALAGTRTDVIQVFEPWVSAAENEGVGVPLHAAHERGCTAYTSFISTRAHLDRYDGPFRAMATALCAFPDWLAAEGSAGLARVVRDFYPDVDSILLERSLRRYQKADLWSCRPEISRAGFARLAQSMLHSGLIQRITPYEVCVAPWAHEQSA